MEKVEMIAYANFIRYDYFKDGKHTRTVYYNRITGEYKTTKSVEQ